MKLIFKAVFVFSILTILTSEAYSRCLEYEDSIKEHVLKARELVEKGKVEKAVEEYKNHLMCWSDQKIFIELGELYEYQSKYYLAEISYKKGNAIEKYNKLEQIRLQNITGNGINNFSYLSSIKSDYYLKRYKSRKIAAYAFSIIGSTMFLAGAGLFIIGKAVSENSPAAQYTLMLGGLSLLNTGIAFNLSSDYSFNKYSAFHQISNKYGGDSGTTPEEYYEYSGTGAHTNKISAKSFRKHGIALMLVSIPMFAATIYSFIDTRKYHDKNNHRDEESWDPDLSELGLYAAYFMQIPAFAPAVISFIAGAKMLSKASEYENLNIEPNILTLDSVTPVINPVSRTYGLSLGFSF